ncbi:isoprenyl transferase [Aquibacillus koreensis]|uniref:Isoprenyl transferase n=1 Tax=Aquibacillus koreensis TaxID=279446 RepID=A0A9X3WPC3_9BACI|nr:isoprenyl transferase [Aquibacillus koreensis]MCT2534555.1 isoprenyl transferase [Aquibacillus koreensis]MDC3421851.1 isoprenyl transferase [Aquibacillus koreensis]
MRRIKLPFLKRKSRNTDQINNIVKSDNLPKHVAIIMDGNGRWANQRGLPRFAGHKEGMDNVKKIVKVANKHHVKVLTLYAFSTENWKRPKPEIDYLMKLPIEFLNTYLPELIEENVRVQTIGEFDVLPAHTKKAVQSAKDRTKDNNGLILNIALNYGSRFEIVQGIKEMVHDFDQKGESIDNLTEEMFSEYLYTKKLGDPDLLIRTSGEIRLSNFLLWQSAYTEFWFTDSFWPDFNEYLFEKALIDYQNRKRRYGGI